MSGYLPRLVDGVMTTLLRGLPAVAVTGPRASGKTTTAARHAATLVRLDRDSQAAAFRADPDVALREAREPVLLDEWQAVPSVLGAVKRAVDDDFRPARFILTGSARADLDTETWPGTGRVVRVSMYGLTVRELTGRVGGELFVDRLLDAGVANLGPAGDYDLADYVDFALRGGFPELALRLDGPLRQAWLDSYVEQLITRDAHSIADRDPDRLRRFFEVLAVNSAAVVENRTLYDAAKINSRTADAYEQLLKNLFVLDAVPAWSGNRLARLSRRPKRYLVDPALMVALLRAERSSVLADGRLLGSVIETFVAAQIRPEGCSRILATTPLPPEDV